MSNGFVLYSISLVVLGFSEHNEESGYWHCRSVSALNRIVQPDDFCSYGERGINDV